MINSSRTNCTKNATRIPPASSYDLGKFKSPAPRAALVIRKTVYAIFVPFGLWVFWDSKPSAMRRRESSSPSPSKDSGILSFSK